MAGAKQGDTVQIHYTGKLEDGSIFDSSRGSEPLEFTIGQGEVIPGFEKAVVGMETGETKSFTIPADEAYGQRHEEMVIEVERSQFPDEVKPEVGMQLAVTQPDGSQIPVVISNVDDAVVTLDANHPLAGRDLTFDIELMKKDGYSI